MAHFANARMFWRSLIVAGLALWALWAYKEGGPPEQRIIQINNALAAGRLGTLHKEDAIFLQDTVRWLFQSAGVKDDDWILNGPTDGSKLSVYTSSPGVEDLTHCGAGNAVYDADLDAIFLDEALVQGIRVVSDGSGSFFQQGWNGQALYLAFVLLHELGHRQLHHGSSGLFDTQFGDATDSASRALEVAADRFAFDALELAYKADLTSGPVHIGKRPDNPSVEAARAELFRDLMDFVEEGFLSQTTDGFYTPFHSDSAHPNFAERLLGVFDALSQQVLPEDLHNDVLRAQDTLSRVDAISSTFLAEVRFPFEVAALYLAGRTLWAASPNGEWATAQIPVQPAANPKKYRKIVAAEINHVPPIPAVESTILEIAGNDAGPTVAIDDKWRLYELRGGQWTQDELRPEGKQKDRIYRSVWPVGSGASRIIAVLSSDGDPMFDAPVLHMIYSDGRKSSRALKDVAQELNQRLRFSEPPLLTFGSIDTELICLALFDRDDLQMIRLRGAVFLKHDLSIASMLLIPEDSSPASLFRPVVVRDPVSGDLVMVGEDLANSGVAIWDVPAGPTFTDAKLRGRIYRLGERTGGEEDGRFGDSFTYLASVQSSNQALQVGMWYDSYFLMERSGELRVMFHPGYGVLASDEEIVAINPGLAPNWGKNTFVLSTR